MKGDTGQWRHRPQSSSADKGPGPQLTQVSVEPGLQGDSEGFLQSPEPSGIFASFR